MKKITLLTLLISLFSCTSTYHVTKGESAYLVNQKKIDNPKASTLLFVALDGEVLNPGFFTKTVNAVYEIPTGKRNIIAHIVYDPDEHFFTNGDLVHGFVKFEYEIKANSKYKIDSAVAGDRATLWLTDEKGNQVTDKISKLLVPFPEHLMIPVDVR